MSETMSASSLALSPGSISTLSAVRQVMSKELTQFFASPVGYLFLAAFLAVTLFVVFWGEAYFARNIADVRPMFEWMPVLLVFLSSTLTMRMWSEERRSGTIEFVSTSPVSALQFVLGKFFACLVLLALALLLTLPLPICISLVADLDWGPVWAGYLAALLLGGAYLAIGLFVSARTDSQIVSLILSVLICGLFYLVGTDLLTKLVGPGVGELLRELGTGTRFESITRGVLDLADLYYYLSMIGVFLALNVFSLETQRWAKQGSSANHLGWILGTGLLVVNLIFANLWLGKLGALRLDVTEGQIYSISDATLGYLQQLQEPLLIRGYFSSNTHPALAPLVPQMRDLLLEYQEAAPGKVRVEIIDPVEDPAAEEEANTKYGIRAVPFQVADRYQASLVNSYFDVLVSYGDQYEVLSFRDLIEVKVANEDSFDVQLRNPEYDVTRSIKQVLFGFQGGGGIFSSITQPVEFIGYVSNVDVLPEPLVEFQPALQGALNSLADESEGKFSVKFVDPIAGDGQVAQQLADDYGFQPMALSLTDTNTFYYYLILTDGDTVVQIPLPQGLSEEAATQGIKEGLKRFAKGLLKTVALSAPKRAPNIFGQQGPQANSYRELKDFLQSDLTIIDTNLTVGSVDESADVLLVIDPTGLNENQIFAIDQFLMQGGTVGLATAPFAAELQAESLSVAPRSSGLEPWLAHMGVSMPAQLVMDPQNAAFPVPVTRQADGFTFQEVAMLDYPYFVDVRRPGLAEDNPITAGLPQLTISWASPIEIDAQKNAQRKIVALLNSSDGAWVSTDTNVLPKFDESGGSLFTATSPTSAHKLGVLIEGRFDSFFAGKSSPLFVAAQNEQAKAQAESSTEPSAEPSTEDDTAVSLGVVNRVIERSSESARLFVFSSNDFLADQVTRMIGAADGTIYTTSAQMFANVVDFALEDQSLLSIRSRGQFNRTLPPMERAEQAQLEYLNYGLALLGIGLVFLWRRLAAATKRRRYASWLGTSSSPNSNEVVA